MVVRQARDSKQALNGRQSVHLFSVIFNSVILHTIPSNNFFLLLFANSRLGVLFLHELHNISFSKNLNQKNCLGEFFQPLTTQG